MLLHFDCVCNLFLALTISQTISIDFVPITVIRFKYNILLLLCYWLWCPIFNYTSAYIKYDIKESIHVPVHIVPSMYNDTLFATIPLQRHPITNMNTHTDSWTTFHLFHLTRSLWYKTNKSKQRSYGMHFNMYPHTCKVRYFRFLQITPTVFQDLITKCPRSIAVL